VFLEASVERGETMANQTNLLPFVKTADGLEVLLTWTCPECQHKQDDTVHPDLGPFFSCTCGNCVKVFSDEQLSDVDQQAWEAARSQAETALEGRR
jgi:hypothetical protein